MKQVGLKISGKVQGVGYRASVKKWASELGISGSVRNEPNGSVYINVEGEEGAIQQLIELCRIGPERARVEAIEHLPAETPIKPGFKID